MSNQSLTNEDILAVHVFRGNKMMSTLERKYYNLVIYLQTESSVNGGRVDDNWDDSCEAAFWYFIRNDPYWSKQNTLDQQRYVDACILKITIYVELFWESLLTANQDMT
jgi:hypothetical protein